MLIRDAFWGAGDLENQKHSSESSLEFSGVILLPARTIWSSPYEVALDDGAAKLDYTFFFFPFLLS